MSRLIFVLTLLLSASARAQVQDSSQIVKMIGVGVPFVLVLGDSLTAGSTLPPSACGLPIVKIGVGGARPSTFITLAEEITASGLVPKLIVVALGINNSLTGYRTDFRATYSMLLQSLPTTPIALATTAPIDPAGSDGSRVNLPTMSAINSDIRDIARAKGATLIELRDLKGFETRDGIHPTKAARPLWDRAIIAGIDRALNCDGSSAHGEP